MTSWLFLATESELIKHTKLTLQINNQYIGLYHLDNRYYAVEDACPHAQNFFLLSQGKVVNETVQCPFHNAMFHIPSGQCLRQPGRDLIKYKIRVSAGEIHGYL
jgi:3-phenylpropionate/trans-cinnamate dioxygenase ferredoxin subunit